MTEKRIELNVTMKVEWPARHYRMPTDDEAVESLIEMIEQSIRDIPGVVAVDVYEKQ